jgi:hypothetical protein
MKSLLLALFLGATLLPASSAWAKKKAPKTSAQAKKGGDNNQVRPPGDKRTNEGAQGRMNATEDVSKEADSPQFGHRP